MEYRGNAKIFRGIYMYKVILSGGGTAGHVNPALAISEIIKDAYPDTEFLYVGTPNGIEKSLVEKAGIPFAPR